MIKHTPGPWVAHGFLVYFNRAGGISLLNAPDREANARLIAAAPKMYSLLAMIAKSGNNEALSIIQEIGNEEDL